MNSPTYKTFYGKYIDLDRLISISEAKTELIESWYNVSFEMHFQLMEKPLKFSRSLNNEEFSNGEDEYGSLYRFPARDENGKVTCEKNLNVQIQEIIDAWEAWKFKNVRIYSFKN